MRGLIDRPNTNKIPNFNHVTVELSKYMTEIEIDSCIGFMETIKDSKWDVNPSVEDCKTQLEIMFGKDRVKELIVQWSRDNQKLTSVFGRLRYIRKEDQTLWDGLDETDNPEDYEKIYV